MWEPAKWLEQQSLLSYPLTSPKVGFPTPPLTGMSLWEVKFSETRRPQCLIPAGNALTTEEVLPNSPFRVHIGSECHVSKRVNTLFSSALVHTRGLQSAAPASSCMWMSGEGWGRGVEWNKVL